MESPLSSFFSSSSPHRNLEKEISFDFGTSAEFSYLYDQCYEMTTSECVPDGALAYFDFYMSFEGGTS